MGNSFEARIPVSNSVVGSTGMSTVVTLPGAPGLTTYITNLIVSGNSLPVGFVAGQIIISGLANSHNIFIDTSTNIALLGVFYFGETGLIASGPNSAITVTVPAFTGISVSVAASGYQR